MGPAGRYPSKGEHHDAYAYRHCGGRCDRSGSAGRWERVALTASGPSKAVASSHREAPLIANDPTADLTDFYLFPSPEKAGTVTMIANVIPLEAPPEGPNYYNLDDSARYRFNIDWNGDGKADRTWTLRTHTTTAYPGTFLYNIGPVHSINDPNLNVRQSWTLWSQKGDGPSSKIGEGITAPNNVGKNSFPNYDVVRQQAVTTLANGTTRLRRAERGSVRDRRRADLRPDRRGRQGHGQPGRLQRPFDRHPGAARADPPVGDAAGHRRLGSGRPHGRRQERLELAASAGARPRSTPQVQEAPGAESAKHWVQVERLGQPLINEVIIPRGLKDYWNSVGPDKDYQFEKYYTDQSKPGTLIHSLNGLLLNPLLTAVLGSAPGATGPTRPGAGDRARRSLGDPAARVQVPERLGPAALDLTFGKGDAGKPVDELRLNTAVAAHAVRQGRPAWPAVRLRRRGRLPGSHEPGLHPAQFDGYPNGRRLGDDVTDIEIAALIGLPIDHLIPSGIQRAYALLALGGPNLRQRAGLGPRVRRGRRARERRQRRALRECVPVPQQPQLGQQVAR